MSKYMYEHTKMPPYLPMPQNMDEKRIYDRVLQNCQPICVNGKNQRREKSKQNRIELEQIFQE